VLQAQGACVLLGHFLTDIKFDRNGREYSSRTLVRGDSSCGQHLPVFCKVTQFFISDVLPRTQTTNRFKYELVLLLLMTMMMTAQSLHKGLTEGQPLEEFGGIVTSRIRVPVWQLFYVRSNRHH